MSFKIIKRLVRALGITVAKESAPKGPTSASLTSGHSILSQTSVRQDHKDLKDAIRELSGGIAHPISAPPKMVLSDFADKPVEEMDQTTLENLARTHFETDPSSSKATDLWKLAVNKFDSTEAAYSLAACLREGQGGLLKDPMAALTQLKALAHNKSYPLAQYALGIMHYNREVSYCAESEHDQSAFTYFKDAARGGVLPALYNVGNCYASGRGVKQSDHNAQLYYSAAVDAGDPMAKFTLGTWLVQGRGGLTKDLQRAFNLQCEAAHSGHPAAMFNVGCHLMTGQGTDRDPITAAKWFQKASDEGNIVQASVNLGNMYREGLGVEKNLVRARDLYARHAMADPQCRALMSAVTKQIAGK